MSYCKNCGQHEMYHEVSGGRRRRRDKRKPYVRPYPTSHVTYKTYLSPLAKRIINTPIEEWGVRIIPKIPTVSNIRKMYSALSEVANYAEERAELDTTVNKIEGPGTGSSWYDILSWADGRAGDITEFLPIGDRRKEYIDQISRDFLGM